MQYQITALVSINSVLLLLAADAVILLEHRFLCVRVTQVQYTNFSMRAQILNLGP
jgi:hypothetical protein